jgi:hypothetical protein
VTMMRSSSMHHASTRRSGALRRPTCNGCTASCRPVLFSRIASGELLTFGTRPPHRHAREAGVQSGGQAPAMLAPAFAPRDADLFPNRSSRKGARCYCCFLQEIISEGRSFTAGILARRRRSERKNSEITACSRRTA